MKILLLIILLISLSTINTQDDARDRFLPSSLISPGALPAPRSNVIDVGMIMMNVSQTNNKLITFFTKMISSIFLYSYGTPLRLIFFTDEESSTVIGDILKTQSGKYLTESLIRNPLTMKKRILMFPSISVAYVNTSEIFSNQRTGIHQLKNYFGFLNDKPYKETPLTGKTPIVWNHKYRHDLFYILPYYYLELPVSMHKLILLDIDLEFSIDMLSLYKQFNQFSPTEVIGCGVTQTPFYLKYFEDYKLHHPGTHTESLSVFCFKMRELQSDTHIGGPGRYQGLNTGVLLLDLQKMRESELYINTTSPDVITQLSEKYKFRGSVGDQDWLTLGKSNLASTLFKMFLKMAFTNLLCESDNMRCQHHVITS